MKEAPGPLWVWLAPLSGSLAPTKVVTPVVIQSTLRIRDFFVRRLPCLGLMLGLCGCVMSRELWGWELQGYGWGTGDWRLGKEWCGKAAWAGGVLIVVDKFSTRKEATEDLCFTGR